MTGALAYQWRCRNGVEMARPTGVGRAIPVRTRGDLRPDWFYVAPAPSSQRRFRAVLSFPAIRVVDDELVLRTVELHEGHRVDFADACVVASVLSVP